MQTASLIYAALCTGFFFTLQEKPVDTSTARTLNKSAFVSHGEMYSFELPPGWTIHGPKAAFPALAQFTPNRAASAAHDAQVFATLVEKQFPNETIRQAIQNDKARNKQQWPKDTFGSAPSIKTRGSELAVVRVLSDNTGPFEAAAFIDDGPRYMELLLGGVGSAAEYRASYPAFHFLVASYAQSKVDKHHMSKGR